MSQKRSHDNSENTDKLEKHHKSLQIPHEVYKRLDSLVSIRRELHMTPEISLQEEQTSISIANKLKGLGLEVSTNIGGYGVVGVLRTNTPGPCLLLRCDMDALPIQDIKQVEYKSQRENAIHACGHDAHMAMLLTAAEILTEKKNLLKGSIKFCFQPAEEIGQGAKKMIETGILDQEPRVDYCFGAHVWASLEYPLIGLKSGVVSSFIARFEISITGKGAHGSQPQEGIDAIVVAAHLINHIQTIVSRQIDPMKMAVISIGTIEGGTASNIIPEHVTMTGTTRARDQLVHNQILECLRENCENIKNLYKCPEIRFSILEQLHAMVNSEEETAIGRQV